MIHFKKNIKKEITREAFLARVKSVNNSAKLEWQWIDEEVAIEIATNVLKRMWYKIID